MNVTCTYCGNPAGCMSSKEWYGRDYGSNIYYFRPCDAYVGTHKGSLTPLGTLANKELRALRSKAHAVIDPYWRRQGYNRKTIYRLLGEYMGTEPNDTHIGMFNNEQCQKVIDGFHAFMKKPVKTG